MHPILFKFGPFTVYSYGALVALGFLAAGLLAAKNSGAYDIPRDKTWNIITIVLISGLLGARMLHVALSFKAYLKDPFSMILFHKGGLAVQGGIIAAVAASVIYIRKCSMPLWKTGDLLARYIPLGQSIGRMGCFMNGCCYGKDGLPAQLFMSAGFLAIFIYLKLISGRKQPFEGNIFLAYIMLFSAMRFLIDFLRADLSPVFMGITTSQYISAIFFITALAIYAFRKAGAK